MESHGIVTSVIAKLEYVKSLPVDELETGLDEVQLKIVDLRDRMIEKVRLGGDRTVQHYLRQVNLALSLIFGLEYPVSEFQRNKIDQTVAVLKPLAAILV